VVLLLNISIKKDLMRYIMKLKQLSLACTMLLATTPGLAAIAGHNVILVHGFQPTNLIIRPKTDDKIAMNGYNYWSQYWNQRAEARLDWSSAERVEGGIAKQIYNKAVTLSQSGLCQDGCVMVTHSTGDLVARYFLEHQEEWLTSAGYQPLNVLAVLDFAGAGGGTELANAAVSAFNAGLKKTTTTTSSTSRLWAAVTAWLGKNFDASKILGVVNDLQPTVARNLGTTPSSIPHLRFAGSGSEFLGITSFFISGTDDGVVPSHSSCGSSKVDTYKSCSPNVAFNGKLTSVKAPDDFYQNYYPVLMGERTTHNGTVNEKEKGSLMTFANNKFLAGLDVEFDTYTEEVKTWWKLFGGDTYQFVRDSDKRTMSEAVFDALNANGQGQ
jgi:hypothetical protein